MRRVGTVTALAEDDVEEPRIGLDGRRLFASIIGWPARMPTAFVALPPDLPDLKPDAILAASPLAVAHARQIRGSTRTDAEAHGDIREYDKANLDSLRL